MPLALYKENLDRLIVERLQLKNTKPDISGWQKVAKIQASKRKPVKIAVVGKYVDLKESYKSLHESLVHGGLANMAQVEIMYVDSEKLNSKNAKQYLKVAAGVLVPGGFGTRGVEGKMTAIQFARENEIPFFGICFGMQLAAIEFARNVCGIKDATSREFVGESNRGGNIVIDSMVEQRGKVDKGGTMRLGAFSCKLMPKSIVFDAYKKNKISERHRHRYEFNNKYKDLFEKNGLVATGINEDRNLVEILENKSHPWFVGVQFHPEFKSKPLSPHPLFAAFVKASLKRVK